MYNTCHFRMISFKIGGSVKSVKYVPLIFEGASQTIMQYPLQFG